MTQRFWGVVAKGSIVSFICCFIVYAMYCFTLKQINPFEWQIPHRATMCIAWGFACLVSFGFVNIEKGEK